MGEQYMLIVNVYEYGYSLPILRASTQTLDIYYHNYRISIQPMSELPFLDPGGFRVNCPLFFALDIFLYKYDQSIG